MNHFKSQVLESCRAPLVTVLGCLALFATTWLSVPPALAQSNTDGEVGAPVRLFPPRNDANTEDKKAEGSILSQPLAQTKEGEEGAGVQVSPLQALDPSSVGLIGPEEGGFGPTLWARSERAQIEALLPRIPVGTVSRAMQELTRTICSSWTSPEACGESLARLPGAWPDHSVSCVGRIGSALSCSTRKPMPSPEDGSQPPPRTWSLPSRA